jgi:hypothetical protein
MLASVGGTTLWVVWCFYKVITTPDETDKLHGFDIDPPDKAQDPTKPAKEP